MNFSPIRGFHGDTIMTSLVRSNPRTRGSVSTHNQRPVEQNVQRAAGKRFSETLANSLSRTADSRASNKQQQIQSVGEGVTSGKSGRRPLATIAAFRYEEDPQPTKNRTTAADPFPGPSITQKDWTKELLTGDLPIATLRKVQDPAALLNARVKLLEKPTKAKITDSHSGRAWSLNPAVLSTMEQALQMKQRLKDLGIDAGAIKESVPKSGPIGIDYSGDDRRIYQIGELNVGLLLHCYAKNPKEFADQRILDEWKVMSAA